MIGAAVGAGFVAFESAGYAFNIGMMYGDQAMISNIFTRGWMAVGTHIAWSSIAGAALFPVKGQEPLKKEHLTNERFIKLRVVAIILHAVWDMPLYFLHEFLFIGLIVVAWMFIFTFIHAGLKQISRLNQKVETEEAIVPDYLSS
ncbi:PrsW family glutamic-type intramembrane protease [Radiobacillus deserti]|uniref:PrsW family glutamic-type intramembrane protease n=1 Tax=Radiobacillus deserti TaxID=2594883 RepID=UPI0038999DC4